MRTELKFVDKNELWYKLHFNKKQSVKSYYLFNRSIVFENDVMHDKKRSVTE